VSFQTITSGKLKRIAAHALFWVFYVLFFGFFYGKYGNDYSWYFLESLVMVPFLMIATYLTIYLILPYYLKKRKLIPVLFFEITLLFTVTLGERVFLRIINDLPVVFNELFGVTFLYLFLETNFVVGIAFAIEIVKKWFEQQKEKHEMEKSNLETELNLLKAQLHPHFLFNTMNNLYSLSVERSAKTSEGIAKISELLRSILYDCNEAEIELDKEIKLIENYIDLEKMRYGNRLNLSFNVDGNTTGKKIAPMLFFTFVENCFKHGSSKNPENPFIEIKISAENKKILFFTENNKPLNSGNSSKKKHGGVGLANARKRLDIIYSKKYNLKISDKPDVFKVRLEIKT